MELESFQANLRNKIIEQTHHKRHRVFTTVCCGQRARILGLYSADVKDVNNRRSQIILVFRTVLVWGGLMIYLVAED